MGIAPDLIKLPRLGSQFGRKHMRLLAIPYPVIDPVALQLGPLSVKWYGLAYIAGLLLGWLYIKRLLISALSGPATRRPSSRKGLTIFSST